MASNAVHASLALSRARHPRPLLQTRNSGTIGESTGIVLRTVDAIGVCGQRMDVFIAINIESKRQQKLAVTPTLAALAANGDGRFTA